MSTGRWLHKSFVGEPRVERVARAVSDLLIEARSEVVAGAPRVLDIGTGDGQVGRRIGECVGATEMVGVDARPNPRAAIDVVDYDGSTLPFGAHAFDVALLCDVLHHAADPRALLMEALRVAPLVGLKDHFAFGPLSRRWLALLDRVGNPPNPSAAAGGTFGPRPADASYLDAAGWSQLFEAAGARCMRIRWPLAVHISPIRWFTRDEIQFAAVIRRSGDGTDR